MPFRIETIHAFLSVAPDGDEGVCAFHSEQFGWMPLIAADPKRLAQLRPIAQQIADERNITIRHVRFENRVEVEAIEAQKEEEEAT